MTFDIIFSQTRVGYQGKPFTLYKLRTMYVGAEHDQPKYQHLNKGIPPTFKAYHDPRLTRLGKILYQTGLDELPQLWNVLKGEMTIIGPRPLPLVEHAQLPLAWRTLRESVKPGIISSWALDGSHSLTQNQWMALDRRDIKYRSQPFYQLGIYGKLIGFLGLKFLSLFKKIS